MGEALQLNPIFKDKALQISSSSKKRSPSAKLIFKEEKFFN